MPESSVAQIHLLVGHKAIEDAAIAFVIDHERRQGRAARDTRHRGAAADVASEGRVIEVKAFARSVRSSGFLMLETRHVEEARHNANFYEYLVENVAQGDPAKFELRVLGGSTGSWTTPRSVAISRYHFQLASTTSWEKTPLKAVGIAVAVSRRHPAASWSVLRVPSAPSVR